MEQEEKIKNIMSQKQKTKKEKKKKIFENKDQKENLEQEIKERIQQKIPIDNINYKEKYFRALAELENFRKRSQKEKEETMKFIIEDTILKFLPIIDNFENALKFSQSASDEVKNWASGFQMIQGQMRDVLHENGIIPFHSNGNTFDPNFHEAMEIVETNDYPDNTIIEEFSKGYKCGNRVIKPAKVKVSKKLNKQEENHDKKK